MNREHFVAILNVALLQTFIFSTFGAFGDSFVIHRTLMLLQFLPLILILNNQKLLENKYLLFLAFATCVNTLFLVDDFQTGYYTSAVLCKSGLVRGRAFAHLMAYQNTGRLVVLDYHADYFLEFVVVHFLSEVAGTSHTLVYLMAIRLVTIVMWSALFIWASNRIKGQHKRFWYVIMATLILMDSRSYNRGVSFAPIIFLTSYLILTRTRSRYHYEITTCALLVAVATLLASFRETLLFAMIGTIAVLMVPLRSRIKSLSLRSTTISPSFIFVFAILAWARIFQFGSHYYAESYINRFFVLLNSIVKALSGELGFHEELLVTVVEINLIDQIIALVSVIGAISLLALLSVLCIDLILRKRNLTFLYFAVLVVYLLVLAVPVSSYLAGKIVGHGTIRDFGSATTLVRSMAPLAVLIIAPHFTIRRKTSRRTKKVILVFVMGFLSLAMIFAPFLFERAEVKSSFDILRVSGDANEAAAMSDGVYDFIVSRITPNETVTVSSENLFFTTHYLLPLTYRVGEDKVKSAVMGPPLVNLFDNGMYFITLHPYGHLLLARAYAQATE